MLTAEGARPPKDHRDVLVEQTVAQIDQKNQDESLEEALTYGTAFSAQVFESAIVYYEMGLACNRQDKTKKAISYYNKAIKIQPDMMEALYDRAELYMVSGDLQKAKKDLRRALKTNHWIVHFRLAEIAGREKDTETLELHLIESVRYGFPLNSLFQFGVHWQTWVKDPILGRVLRRVIFLYGSEDLWQDFTE